MFVPNPVTNCFPTIVSKPDRVHHKLQLMEVLPPTSSDKLT